jgi:hypothetical protein
MKNIEKIQNLLPLGYIYLIIIGILNETAFFYQLDINILKYSSIIDILIIPIAILTSHIITFITIASIFILCYYLPSILYKHGHKKWIQKIFELKKTKNELSDTEIKNYYLFIAFKTLAIFLLSVYLGYGIAQGYITSERMKNNKLHYDYKLNYNTGESEEICLLESNSVYCFYVEKGSKSVKIAPISGIKNIELTKEINSK